jgi:hypothetical protein
MSRRRTTGLWLAAGVCAALIVAPATAEAVTIHAHTNLGGRCRLQSISQRPAPLTVNYGVRVDQCVTQVGIRRAISVGFVYTGPVQLDTYRVRRGPTPYQFTKTFNDPNPADSSLDFRTRIDVEVVLFEHHVIEKWLDPGSNCRVTTNFHKGDTLTCHLIDQLPA